MNPILRSCSFPFAIVLASLFPLLSSCASFGPVDYEQTGMVIDDTTGKPIEGAYVLAVYLYGGNSMGGSFSYCHKTLGMYTGADGKYHFPVVVGNDANPMPPVAIKPGYRYVGYDFVNDQEQGRNQRLYYTGQNVRLAPQDPTKPYLNYVGANADCSRAPTRQDAAAGATFLTIEVGELEKYGEKKTRIESLRGAIRGLGNLPEVATPEK